QHASECLCLPVLLCLRDGGIRSQLTGKRINDHLTGSECYVALFTIAEIKPSASATTTVRYIPAGSKTQVFGRHGNRLEIGTLQPRRFGRQHGFGGNHGFRSRGFLGSNGGLLHFHGGLCCIICHRRRRQCSSSSCRRSTFDGVFVSNGR